jgi:hypothetical protein
VLLAFGAIGPAIPVEPALPVELVAIEDDGSFGVAAGVDDGGAVLVRPDGHIVASWRRAPHDHRAALADAVDVALGRGPGHHARPIMEPARRRKEARPVVA